MKEGLIQQRQIPRYAPRKNYVDIPEPAFKDFQIATFDDPPTTLLLFRTYCPVIDCLVTLQKNWLLNSSKGVAHNTLVKLNGYTG